MVRLEEFIEKFKEKIPDTDVRKNVRNPLFFMEFYNTESASRAMKPWVTKIAVVSLEIYKDNPAIKYGRASDRSGYISPFSYGTDRWHIVEIVPPTKRETFTVRITRHPNLFQ